jgi:dTDP-glucose 4,6-dehydratase
VIGVHVLLEAVRAASSAAALAGRPPVRFLQVSTDEVYGSVEDGHSTENDRLEPRSPYSAAKAAGELLVRSYVVTHGIDAVMTRGSNTYGPYHHPEKLIPLFVTNAIDDQPLPLYGDGLQRRDWLYVSDHAGAIDHVLRHGTSGETYNLPGSAEMTNRDVVAALLERLGKPWSLVRSVPDRPGHDRRYALDGSRLAAIGWHNRTSFEDGLAATVDWYRANERWWRAARSGDWDAYYERQYGTRLAAGQAIGRDAGLTSPDPGR